MVWFNMRGRRSSAFELQEPADTPTEYILVKLLDKATTAACAAPLLTRAP